MWYGAVLEKCPCSVCNIEKGLEVPKSMAGSIVLPLQIQGKILVAILFFYNVASMYILFGK